MKGTIIIVCLIALIAAMMMVTPTSATTRTVCAAGCDYTDIQAALDASSEGDTVFVYSGTYDDFSINKPNIIVKGEGADLVTIDGGVTDNIIMPSTGGNATGCVLEGFKIINSPSGVHIGDSSYGPAPNCIIKNNVFEGLTSSGGLLTLTYSSNTTIENNVFSNCTGSWCALYVGAGTTGRSNFSTIANNTFINHTVGSRAMTIRGANTCTVVNNTFINNAGDGIRLYKTTAANNTITKNNISSNGGIIYLKDAGEGNKIYLNDFVDNTASVTYSGTSPTVTYWNSTEEIKYVYDSYEGENYLGNYWGTDYTGTDADSDGIGDTAYGIPGSTTGDKDYRPLMAGYENYPAPAGGLCGDVNEDGSVDFIDVGLVGRHKLYGDALADEWAADVNGDGSIDFIDVGLIGRHKLYGDALCCK